MTTQVKPIRGKVARVLNDREVAINRGAVDGVESGMEFNILASDVQKIQDPDTKEYLGSVRRPKTRVKVTLVYDRLSVAETFRTRRVNVGGTGVGIGLFDPPKWENHYETLFVQGSFVQGLYEVPDTKGDLYVSTGDQVVQVLNATQFAEREPIHEDATR